MFVTVDIGLIFDVEQTLEDIGLFEFSEGHLIVVLTICHIIHPSNHAIGVVVLEFRGIFQKLQSWVDCKNLFEEELKIIRNKKFLLWIIC